MSMQNRATYPLDQSPLFKMASRSKLAKLLGVSTAELRALAIGEELYSEFDIPKKSGDGVRHVENPCKALKRVQSRLAKVLARINPPEFLFCPVKRRCYVTNAAAHRENRVVQCLDIRKFFPSTPQRRVFWFFHTVMQCERDIAGLLANLACYQGHLPTGSPLSPIMAYFAYYDLWARIAAFCKEQGHTFTVYIDDVTISGARVPKSDVWEVQKMIHGVGLRYHKEKTFVDQPVEVTGVILRDGKLVAPFRQHKKMYEARTLLEEAREDDRHALLGRLAGITGQIRQIAAKN
jgi:Reverse transcriptase (RNA-dependent DNA polymerase)